MVQIRTGSDPTQKPCRQVKTTSAHLNMESIIAILGCIWIGASICKCGSGKTVPERPLRRFARSDLPRLANWGIVAAGGSAARKFWGKICEGEVSIGGRTGAGVIAKSSLKKLRSGLS